MRTRREILYLGLLAACKKACPDFAMGELMETLPFNENPRKGPSILGGAGLLTSLFTDLSKVDEDNMITPNEDFYVRTGTPELPTGDYEIVIEGEVEAELRVPVETLENRDMGEVVMECSGNSADAGYGLLSAARYGGVPVLEIAYLATPKAGATRILIEGWDYEEDDENSKAGCAWVFLPEELEQAFLAVTMNGEALPAIHGGPVRLVIPNWYGCCQPKWVKSIRWVTDDEPATSQMLEFASRTHQPKASEWARDYVPATMEPCAMPTRVERWKVEGREVIRVVGVLWGGPAEVTKLSIKAGSQQRELVDLVPGSVNTWRCWSVCLSHVPKGEVEFELRVEDEGVSARRLEMGWYRRSVIFS